jgi:hypothetical protein
MAAGSVASAPSPVLVDLVTRIGVPAGADLDDGLGRLGEVLVGQVRRRHVDARGAVAGLRPMALERFRRDLEESDRPIREEERVLDPVDEHRALAVHRAQVRAQQPGIGGLRQVVQVDEQRLLVGDVDDDLPDHAVILPEAPARVTGPKVPPRARTRYGR